MESKRGGLMFPLFFTIQVPTLNKLFTVSYSLFTDHYSLFTLSPMNNEQLQMNREQITMNSSFPKYKFVNNVANLTTGVYFVKVTIVEAKKIFYKKIFEL
jgi:hypothetical protein